VHLCGPWSSGPCPGSACRCGDRLIPAGAGLPQCFHRLRGRHQRRGLNTLHRAAGRERDGEGCGRDAIRHVGDGNYDNSAEGEEELHEDEEVDKLVKGGVVERNGKNWKIVEILTTVGVSVSKPRDIVRVYLTGPM
jgi:hypothetical protein